MHPQPWKSGPSGPRKSLDSAWALAPAELLSCGNDLFRQAARTRFNLFPVCHPERKRRTCFPARNRKVESNSSVRATISDRLAYHFPMSAPPQNHGSIQSPKTWTSDAALLTYLALATVIFHVLPGNRYGFHRDDLATLDDARHLAWGYIAYPPVTPFFGRLSLTLFGASLVGFRFFA